LDRIAEGDLGGRWDPSLWVAASQNRLRTYAGVAGREIAGVERKGGKEVVCIDVVEIQGEYNNWNLYGCANHVAHRRGRCCGNRVRWRSHNILSPPSRKIKYVLNWASESLRHLAHTLTPRLRHPARHASSDSQGDFLTISENGLIELVTMMNFSRARLPLVNFSVPAPTLRDRPEPAEVSGIVSWLWSARTKAGTEIDALRELAVWIKGFIMC
jgi:hypothetical protein